MGRGSDLIGMAGMSGTGTDGLGWIWIGRQGLASCDQARQGLAGKLYGD